MKLITFLVSLDDLEATRTAQRDMHAALKARKEVLEEALRKKTEELKAICIKEGVRIFFVLHASFDFSHHFISIV